MLGPISWKRELCRSSIKQRLVKDPLKDQSQGIVFTWSQYDGENIDKFCLYIL